MGRNELSSFFPKQQQDGEKKHSSLTEIFEELCPYYISIGVSYEDYWNGEFEICKFARKAENIRQKRANYNAWLNSIYSFRVMLDVSPAFRDFGNDQKTISYSVEEPFPLSQKEVEEAEKRRIRKIQEEWLERMRENARQHNQALKNKQNDNEKKEG